MQGKCEVLKKGCIGCEGLLYDIDKLKLECETFKDYIKKYDEGEQMKWNLKK